MFCCGCTNTRDKSNKVISEGETPKPIRKPRHAVEKHDDE